MLTIIALVVIAAAFLSGGMTQGILAVLGILAVIFIWGALTE